MNNWYGVIMTSMSFMDVFLSKSPICNIHMKKEKKKTKRRHANAHKYGNYYFRFKHRHSSFD